jgi:hypothetical protein
MTNLSRPIFLSITTLPSRIDRMRPTLESLLNGQLVPNKIYVSIPEFSIRESRTYKIPSFLNDKTFCGSIIETIRADEDWGPGTKLLGCAKLVPSDAYLIVADDDVKYRSNFVSDLYEAQRSAHSASFSFYTYRCGGLTIGQGCDGFSFFAANLSDIYPFAEKFVRNSNLMFHDDLWVSFFLASKGIRICSLSEKLAGGLVYEVEHEVNALRYLDGELNRSKLAKDGLRRLMRDTKLNRKVRWKIGATALSDEFLNFSRKVTRKIRTISRI